MIVGISLLLAIVGAALLLIGADTLGAILLAVGLAGGVCGLLVHIRREANRPDQG